MKKISRETFARLMALVQETGVLRTEDAVRAGIPRVYLLRAIERGKIKRVSWGVYALADKVRDETQALIEVTSRVPNGVICLHSALRLHKLTPIAPDAVWIMMARKSKKTFAPEFTLAEVRIIRCWKTTRLEQGVEEMQINSQTVRVTNPARTVVDCFRYRRLVGLEFAVKVLHTCIRKKRCTFDELWEYVKLERAAKIMKPYIKERGAALTAITPLSLERQRQEDARMQEARRITRAEKEATKTRRTESNKLRTR